MSEHVPILVRNVLKVIYLIQLFISTCEYLPVSVKYATQSLWKAKTIKLAKTWPNETGYVTQWKTWHCEKLRDVARINLTQRNTLMKLNAKKPATWRNAKMVRFAAKICYVTTVSDIAKNYMTLRKLRDVVHTNVTQRNIWIKRDATKPAAWLSENITLCGEKYVTLRQHYIVSKMSGNMDWSLWRHCLVSAIFVRIESEATIVTSPGVHDKMLCEVDYPFRNFNGWNVQVLELGERQNPKKCFI